MCCWLHVPLSRELVVETSRLMLGEMLGENFPPALEK